MQYSIIINNQQFPILIRKNARSKNMVLRYLSKQAAVSLSLPRYVSIRQGLNFAQSKSDWLEKQIAAHPQNIGLHDGAQIVVLSQRITICHVGGRGTAKQDGDKLLVHGDAAFLERRVREWVIAKARQEIEKHVQHKTALIGLRAKKITLRDTTSSWGSCNHAGHLSFSWRLVFAPPEVLEYVVAHEVAHLMHLNHSPAFWQQVAVLCPDYKRSYTWLKRHGKELHVVC